MSSFIDEKYGHSETFSEIIYSLRNWINNILKVLASIQSFSHNPKLRILNIIWIFNTGVTKQGTRLGELIRHINPKKY